MWKDDSLSFVTPDAWLVDRGVRRKYDGLVFSRSKQAGDVIGVWHRAFDQAIRQALESPANLASIRGLPLPIVLFQIYDQVTEHSGPLQSFTSGVTVNVTESRCQLLNDVELLHSLNSLGLSRTEPPAAAPEEISRIGTLAEAYVRERLRDLSLPFVAPGVRMQLIMWPGVTLKSVS